MLPAPALGDRALFPELQATAYLNHCGVSPASSAVQTAARTVVDDYARRGSGAFGDWMRQRLRLKGLLAPLIGASPADLGLVGSTSQGVIAVAMCFPWRAGDRILGFQGEFPTNVTPWQRAAELYQLRHTLLPLDGYADGSGDGLGRLEDELRRGVRLVAVSAVQFQTGLRMPILEMARLCRAHGAELFVDGIQAVGALPTEDLAAEVDYLTCGSHKWLMGLEGAAFLYVHPARVAALRPHLAGWLSHQDGWSFLFEGEGHLRYDRPLKQSADVFEVGAQNTLGFAALEAAVELISALGTGAIHAHVGRYLDALEAGLVARGFQSLRARDPALRSNILALRPPEGVALGPLVGALGERGVVAAMPDGRLRFGPHWPNALDEVPRVLDALDEALAEGARAG